jgi:hypothetical protein
MGVDTGSAANALCPYERTAWAEGIAHILIPQIKCSLTPQNRRISALAPPNQPITKTFYGKPLKIKK